MLEILETNCTDLAQHLRSLRSKGDPPTSRGTWGNFGETRGGVGKNGVLENKSGSISETHKDGGKVTMDYGLGGGGYELTNALSGTGKATDFKFCRNIHRVYRNKSL